MGLEHSQHDWPHFWPFESDRPSLTHKTECQPLFKFGLNPSHGFIFQLPSVSPFSSVSSSCLHCPALASVFAPRIWCSPLFPTVFWLQPSTFPGQSFPTPLTIVDYIICRAQCIMKMWVLWFKKQKKGLCSFFCGLSLDLSLCFLLFAVTLILLKDT